MLTLSQEAAGLIAGIADAVDPALLTGLVTDAGIVSGAWRAGTMLLATAALRRRGRPRAR